MIVGLRSPLTVACVCLSGLAILGVSGWQWFGSAYRMPSGTCPALTTLSPEAGRAEAIRDTAAGDVHLRGVYGYSLTIPGVDDDAVARQYRVEPIPCTSDAIMSRRHRQFLEAAKAYAAAYNVSVLSLRAKIRS